MMLCVLNSSLSELVSIGFVFVLTREGTSRASPGQGVQSTTALIEDHPTPLPKFASKSRSGDASKAPAVLISNDDIIVNRSLDRGSTQGVWLAAEELVLLWTKDKHLPLTHDQTVSSVLVNPVLLLEPKD
jgi:hypothetical protein